MTKTCIVCKKQPIPYDKSRSFHKFPDDTLLKDKWISALNLSRNVTKNSRICSDHFLPEAFHMTDGYTRLRKLLPNAVPSMFPNAKKKQLSDITNTSAVSNTTNTDVIVEENCAVVISTAVEENVSVKEIMSCADTTNRVLKRKSLETTDSATEKINILICEESNCKAECEELDVSNMKMNKVNLKRKRSDLDEQDPENYISKKRIRFKDGFQTQYLSRSDFTSDDAWDRFMKYTIYKNNQIRASQKRSIRIIKKIQNFKELVETLKNRESLAVTDYLQGLPENIKQLITRMKEKKRTAPFPSHLKTFARTLHFHSPAAYEMVRRSFLKCLPSIETINSWNSSKNYKPGICQEVIDHVSELVKNQIEKGKSPIFNITFDEMNIKQWAYYCKASHEWKGLVNLGGQLQDIEKNENVKASKALVFMLVNINGGFKTPVAYYFTNSLSGSDKAILLKDLLNTLYKNNIDIVSVTFDGDESNQKACKFLGANFDYSDEINFKPYFQHPSTSNIIYIFFDPCHMLKLVRNYFALKGPIIYNNSEYIQWDYIKKLNAKQYEEQLHCACKIKNRHVHFFNEKMKVFLAAQVLSTSTATALRFLEFDLMDRNFKGASATSTFCQIFNDIFDILNIKNRFCKSASRQCIMEKNLSEIKLKIDEYINYIKQLQINVPIKIKATKRPTETTDNKENSFNNSTNKCKIVRKPVTESKYVRTGFIGFVICLTNLYSLCESLFKKKIVDYFLSYKISQDHVEMFFALIRRMNGYTSNPTTIQFQSAYKKLLLNNINITVPASANCIPQDKTLLLSDASDASDSTNEHSHESKLASTSTSTTKKEKITNSHLLKTVTFPINDFLHKNINILEHDYSKNEGWAESEYLEQIIKHTAGSVVYSIKKLIHCTDCLNMLYSKNSTNASKLTKLKDRGGLHFASDDVNLICLSAERIIRRFRNCLMSKNIYFNIVSETLKILPTSILDFNNHVLDQDPLHDHRQEIIYLIVQNYVDKRLKHESNKVGDLKYRTRMYYNKLTIFKGE